MKAVFRLTWSVFAVFLLSIAFSQKAHADTKVSQSGLYWGIFQGDAPIAYSWRGTVRVNYRRSGNWVQIQKVDMSALIFQAGRSDPLNMVANISVDVYSYGRYVTTIYPRYNGSYIYSPNDKLFGGVDYPNFWTSGVSYKANIVVLAKDGLGGYRRSWNF